MGVDASTPRVIDPGCEDHEPGPRAYRPDNPAERVVRSAIRGEPGYNPDVIEPWEIRLDERVFGPAEYVVRFDCRAGFVDVYDPLQPNTTQTRRYGRVEARKLP